MISILYPDDAGVIETISLLDLDATHDMSSTPTEHPVEDGSTIADHIKVELDSFSARVLVSNSLVEAADSHMGGATPTTYDVAGITVQGFSSDVNRVQLVFDALRDLRERRVVCTIQTNLRRYESMVLTRLAWPETTSDGIELTLDAKQIRVVSTRTIANPQPRQTRGHPRTNGGTVATQAAPTTPEPPQTPPQRSIAASALDSLFGGG